MASQSNSEPPITSSKSQDWSDHLHSTLDLLYEQRARIGRDFLCGGIAGGVSRTLVSPLELLKIRYMCGHDKIKNSSVWQSLKTVYKHEGIRGYYRGNLSNVVRIVPFSSIQLSTFPLVKSILTKGDERNMTPTIRFWAGVTAGCTATLLTYPLDFIRCRLSLQTESSQLYKGIMDGLITVIRKDGFLALYQGLVPSLAGIIPYSGIQLFSYDMFKELFATHTNLSPNQAAFLSGSFAGIVAQSVAFPIELIRRRMQTHGFNIGGIVDERAARPVGKLSMWKEFRSVIKHDGVRGLYRGLIPNYYKILPAAGSHFLVFEFCKRRYDAIITANKKPLL